MNYRSFLSFVLLSALSACGGGPNPDRDALNAIPSTQNVTGEKFVLLSAADALFFGTGTLSGTGTVRFADDLVGVETAFHYGLTFTLQDGGELTLVSHANASLGNGVEVRFKRSGGTLSVFATAAGRSDDWSSFFTTIDASTQMKIGMDFHNNEAITHMIVWNDLVSTSVDILDSGVDVDGSPGKGHGQNWGLVIKNAEVKNILKDEPRNEH